MSLPLHYLFVAGLGRRTIGPQKEVQAALVDVLKQIAAAAPDAQPVAMASGAVGADQVFLEAAITLGWPIRLVLPVPAYVFEQDFTSTGIVDGREITEVDQAGLDNFRRLSAAAVEIEVIPPTPGRRESFTRCGNTLVAEADVVVALWDHLPGKQGGTNESLLLVERSGVPLVVIDVQSGRPLAGFSVPEIASLGSRYRERHAPQTAGKRGTVLDDIDEAIRHSLSRRERDEFLAKPVGEQLKQFGRILGDRAAKRANFYKWMNLLAILSHAAASLFGLVALIFAAAPGTVPEHVAHAGDHRSVIIKIGLVSLAALLALLAKVLGHQNQWVKARFVREVNRSLAATAEVSRVTGDPHDTFVPSSIWILFRHLRRPLLFFHALQQRLYQDVVPGAGGKADSTLVHALRAYRRDRTGHIGGNYRGIALGELSQHDYQLRKRNTAALQHHAINFTYAVFMVVFFACGWALMTDQFPDHAAAEYRTVKLLMLLLPVLSAALLVMPNLWDVHRRHRVAPALVRTLARLDGEAAELEKILVDLAAGIKPGFADGTPVWEGSAEAQRPLAEVWVRARFAAIVREAEHAILTEVIGFKTFVENAEVG